MGQASLNAGRGKLLVHLTTRERQILQLVVDGCSNEEIATRLGVRRQTVKNRLSIIFHKTGSSSRVQLAVWALRRQVAR